jgi:peptidoglycan/LPS O-acetylase OafA/YrhL
MLELKIRRALVVLLAGLFFLVAATAELNGAGPAEAFLKAGVSCAVVTGLAIALLRTVEDAVVKLSKHPAGTRPGAMAPTMIEGPDDAHGDR